jgi:hypothetical protein
MYENITLEYWNYMISDEMWLGSQIWIRTHLCSVFIKEVLKAKGSRWDVFSWLVAIFLEQEGLWMC